MATNFPTSLDTFVNPASTDTLDSATVPHAAQHDNINDAVLAVETALGANLANVAKIASANTFTTSPQTINGASSAIGLIVKGNATTPGNLQEWRDSSGTALASVSSAGLLTATTLSAGATTVGALTTGSINQFSVGGNIFSSYAGTATYNYSTGATLSANTKTVNLGTGGASGGITNINIGTANAGVTSTISLSGSVKITGLTSNGTTSGAPTIASATTIAPTTPIAFISGTTAIVTITAPSPISTNGGSITLIPTGAFTTTTAGNIALASTATVSRTLTMTYDPTTAKWYPSY